MESKEMLECLIEEMKKHEYFTSLMECRIRELFDEKNGDFTETVVSFHNEFFDKGNELRRKTEIMLDPQENTTENGEVAR